MKKIIASILSLVFLSGLPTNCSFAKEIQPAETSNHTASRSKNNARKKSEQEKYINKMYENEKKYSDSVNKEIEKVKNMSEKELKRYLNKSYLILYGPRSLSFILSFFFTFFWEKLGALISTLFLKIYKCGFEKGFNQGENKRNIKKDLSTSDYEHILISDMKRRLKLFLINFHPDVIFKNIKDPTFFDKIFPELELLYNKAQYFCDKGFFTREPHNDVERSSTEIFSAIGKE